LHRVPLGSILLHSYIVYPDRAQRAPVLLIEASNQGLTDWLRAVADQAAQEGFIAVVPDVLSGMGPHGGYSDSFASEQDMAKALRQMDPRERERRIDAVRDDALQLLAASGKSASLVFDWSADPRGSHAGRGSAGQKQFAPGGLRADQASLARCHRFPEPLHGKSS
jgi:carboxymethylenebutenolidase